MTRMNEEAMGKRVARWAGWCVGLAALLLATNPAAADTASDRPAAILVFPKVVVDRFAINRPAGMDILLGDFRRDTIFQISNTSDQTVELQCFYIDATSHCSFTQSVCEPERDIGCPLEGELCLPNWTETDFRVFVTPHQPLAWSAATGMAREDVPLDGVFFRGIGGANNAGTSIPPLALGSILIDVPNATNWQAYKGELKCVAVDEEGRGAARNVLIGKATLLTTVSILPVPNIIPNSALLQQRQIQSAWESQYSAVGVQAIEGDNNGDGVLELGGERDEYNACPNVLVLDHFFDFAANPVDPTRSGVDIAFHATDLTLVPCTEDIRNQAPVHIPVQYLVFNEFEQRFSTSAPLDCFFQKKLSLIDTPDPSRSIFSVFVAGTLTGQTRIRGIGSGVLGVAERRDAEVSIGVSGSDTYLPSLNAAVNLHSQGERTNPDRIVLP